MPLQPQNVTVKLGQGIDTKTDPKQLMPGKLTTLENGVFTTGEEISKRNGSVLVGNQISGAVAISTPANKGILAYDSVFGYSYSPALAAYENIGRYSGVEVTTKNVNSVSGNGFLGADSAIHVAGGITVYTNFGGYYSVVDTASGNVLVGQTLISGVTYLKPVVLGNYVVIVYLEISSQRLKGLPIPIATPGTPGASFYIMGVSDVVSVSPPQFDVTVFNSVMYVAWYDPTATAVGYVTVSAALSVGTVHSKVEDGSKFVSIFADTTASQIWIAYSGATNVKYFVLNSTLASTVLVPTVVEAFAGWVISGIAGGVLGSGNATIYYSNSHASTNITMKNANLTNAGVVSGIAVFGLEISPVGKCFFYQYSIYIPVSYNGYQATANAQILVASYYLMDNNGYVAAMWAQGLARDNGLALLPENNIVGSLAANIAYVYISESINQGASDGAIVTAIGAVKLNFSSYATYQDASIGGNLFSTGGYVSCYDGNRLSELNFFSQPIIDSITDNSGGGGSVAAGTYQYVAIFEFVDNNGQLQRSATSNIVSHVVASGSSTNSIVIRTLKLTNKVGTIVIKLYRSNGGPYYLLGATPTTNNPAVLTITITDNKADATIAGGDQPYTTGGVVDNTAPPACTAITTYKNRLFIIPSENKQSYMYSKQVTPGIAVEFSQLFDTQIGSRGGDTLAIFPLDDKLIFFKETDLEYMVGDGPAPTGSQNDFSDPQLITTDVGLKDVRSVVQMPLGLMFKSTKGIYLLDRSLNATYIGADVAAYNSDVVVSANLMPDRNEVRFEMLSGVTLVYDYFYQQWSVFTGINAVGAAIWNGTYIYMNSTGHTLQETPGVYTDNGAFIKLKLVWGWISFAQLQGYMRLWKVLVLGQYKSAHQLQVTVYQDFKNTGGHVSVFTVPTSPPYQIRFFPTNQLCEAVQVTVEDNQSSNFGEGYSISGLAFEVGVESGLQRVPPTYSQG